MSKFTFERDIVELNIEGKLFHLDMDRDPVGIINKFSEALKNLGAENERGTLPEKDANEISKTMINELFNDNEAFDMMFEDVRPTLDRVFKMLEHALKEADEYKAQSRMALIDRLERRNSEG